MWVYGRMCGDGAARWGGVWGPVWLRESGSMAVFLSITICELGKTRTRLFAMGVTLALGRGRSFFSEARGKLR